MTHDSPKPPFPFSPELMQLIDEYHSVDSIEEKYSLLETVAELLADSYDPTDIYTIEPLDDLISDYVNARNIYEQMTLKLARMGIDVALQIADESDIEGVPTPDKPTGDLN